MSRLALILRRHTRSRAGSRRGFSLVEVMVGLVLMSIGLLGMVALSVTVSKANREATNRTRADQLLHEKIEEFQTSRYDDIVAGVDTMMLGQVEFVRTWTITEDVPIDDVKLISIDGLWTEQGSDKTVYRKTYISRPGR